MRRIRYHQPDTLDIATDGVRLMFSGNAAHGRDARKFLEAGVVTGALKKHSRNIMVSSFLIGSRRVSHKPNPSLTPTKPYNPVV